MLAELRSRTEALFGPGSYLSGARYAPSGGAQQPLTPHVELQLKGRVFDKTQRLRIVDECRHLLAVEPAWRNGQKLPAPGAAGATLVVVDKQLEDEALSPETREKLATVRKFLFSDPQLHGAWVDVAECKDLRGYIAAYEVCLWMDSDRAAAQKQAVLTLLNRWLGAGKYSVVKESALPLARTVARLQRTVPADSPATFVCGAYYAQADAPASPVEIMLYGGARDKNARELIVNEFTLLQKLDAAWATPATLRGSRPVAVDRELLPWTLSRDSRTKLAQISREIDAQKELRGAWIELAECLDHAGRFLRYNVHVYFDADAAPAAKEGLKQVLEDNLRGQPYVIAREEPLSLANLASQINAHLGQSRSMDGCVVQGCSFVYPPAADEAKPPQAQMKFLGRIVDEGHRKTLKETIGGIVDFDLVLRAHRADFEIDAESGVQSVPPSIAKAALQFNLGLQHFWKNDYAGAAVKFLQASAESPETVEYRYWQAVCALKLGHADRARDIMQIIVARQPNLDPETTRRLYMSLQRIQGNMRTDLAELENVTRSQKTAWSLGGIGRP